MPVALFILVNFMMPRTHKTVAWTVFTLLVLAFNLPAQANNFTKSFDACMGNAQANVAMVDCIDEEIKRQDARLNKTYATLRDDVDASRRPALLEAQRAWIKFRDLNCGFHLDPNGGSIAPLLASDCVMRMTANRADELSQLLAR
jgi:uncharacterized protein YecT (DUF1311 family)